MSQRDKNKTRDRYLREQEKHGRTRAEERALQEEARRRKAQRQTTSRTKPKKRSVDEWEDSDDAFEKIGRSPRFRRTAENPPPVGATPPSSPAHREDEPLEASIEGTVMATHRDRIEVEVEGKPWSVPRVRGIDAVVGDRVLLEELGATRQLVGIAPRRTQLCRQDPSDPRRQRVLAANVDYAVIVASTRRPTFRPGLVERVLLALRQGGPAPIICVSKTDLLENEADLDQIERALTPWRTREILCLFASSETGEGIDELRSILGRSTCVFVGHSGVGKSSLVNALDADLAQHIGRVREADGKGRHTTTSSRMFILASGLRLIDTPGVRQFGLKDLTREDLDEAFPDVGTHAARCRFTDCRHDIEPDCAVRMAVEAGQLPPERVISYLRLRDTSA